MSLNRWKVLACTLTIGVGGLAVFATPPSAEKTEAPKEPVLLPDLTVKPASPAQGADTPAPAKPVTTDEFELVVPDPVVTSAAPAGTTKKPASEPVFEPVTPIVPAGATDGKDPPKPDDKKKPDADKPVDLTIPPLDPKPVVPFPDVPKVEGSKPAPAPVDPPPLAPAVKVEAAPPAVFAPAAPPRPDMTAPAVPSVKPDPGVAPAPLKPDPTSVTSPPPATGVPPAAPTMRADAAAGARLKMLLRMGDGQPRFEIRNAATTELLLKVYGERIEMQAPPDGKSTLAGVTALGRVRFTAPGIEGTCDHLTLLSGTGEVLLKGNIHLKSKRGKAWSELTAEKMVYQIGSAGLSASGARNPVTPASYIPD